MKKKKWLDSEDIISLKEVEEKYPDIYKSKIKYYKAKGEFPSPIFTAVRGVNRGTYWRRESVIKAIENIRDKAIKRTGPKEMPYKKVSARRKPTDSFTIAWNEFNRLVLNGRDK